jgi:hypothetical protein
MSAVPSRTAKLEQLNKKQVHAMALENLKQHVKLSSNESSPLAYLFLIARVKVIGCSNRFSVEKSLGFMPMDDFSSFQTRSPQW